LEEGSRSSTPAMEQLVGFLSYIETKSDPNTGKVAC
jgi:hypothetical protein